MKRTLKMLYKLIWIEIKNKDYIPSLCETIWKMCLENKITNEEHTLIMNNMLLNKPSSKTNSEFLESDNWGGNTHWWKEEEDTNPINRKNFIKKMLNEN